MAAGACNQEPAPSNRQPNHLSWGGTAERRQQGVGTWQWFCKTRDVAHLTWRRVLIADSDPAVRQQLFSALLAVDVFSDIAVNVTDALEKLDGQAYGVVLLDIALPGGMPEQVLARIGTIPTERRPIVLVAAANASSVRSLDVEIVQIVLRRPLALHQTVDVIRSCVESLVSRPDALETDGDGEGNGDQLTS